MARHLVIHGLHLNARDAQRHSPAPIGINDQNFSPRISIYFRGATLTFQLYKRFCYNLRNTMLLGILHLR